MHPSYYYAQWSGESPFIEMTETCLCDSLASLNLTFVTVQVVYGVPVGSCSPAFLVRIGSLTLRLIDGIGRPMTARRCFTFPSYLVLPVPPDAVLSKSAHPL